MGDYDRIIKNNIERIVLTLSFRYLGLKIKHLNRIREKLQILEREVDFAAFIETYDGRKSILHIEFQVGDDPGMLLRMVEYHGIWLRSYDLPIHHFVVYLGKKTPAMENHLDPQKIFNGFTLLDFSCLDPEELLRSDVPEEVILAVLGKFSTEQSLTFIKRILYRLKELSSDEKSLKKYINQLTILSRLRKLEAETKKQATDMPIHYDIETDGLYLEGIEKGEKKGLEKAVKSVMSKLLNYSDDQIADLLGAPLDLVQKVRSSLKKKGKPDKKS